MLALHDRTRYALCLLALLFFGILPAIGVVGWCVVSRTFTAADRVAADWSCRLGVEVSLDSARHLRPGQWRYENVRLADPETGQSLLQCQTVELAWTNDANGKQLALTLAGLQTDGIALNRLARVVADLLEARGGLREPRLRFAANSLAIRQGDQTQHLADLQGSLQTISGGVLGELAFRLEGSAEPTRIRVGRNRQTLPPATGFEIHTGKDGLPCLLLAHAIGAMGKAGPRSRFTGYLGANHAADGWQGELAGQFSEIDFGLWADWFPHKLNGVGQIEVAMARFRRGHLEEARGNVRGGAGWISRSLLAACAAQWGLTAENPRTQSDLAPYERLAFDFQLDGQGLRLIPPADADGALMVDRYGRLLSQPNSAPIPVTRLVQLLLPPSDHQMPACRQSERLLPWLPLPETLPPAETSVASPGGSIRQ